MAVRYPRRILPEPLRGFVIPPFGIRIRRAFKINDRASNLRAAGYRCGMTELSSAEVTAQLLALGVEPGAVLLVHTSFRAVRPIEDGPTGLITALRGAIGPEGTLVMPSWTGSD